MALNFECFTFSSNRGGTLIEWRKRILLSPPSFFLRNTLVVVITSLIAASGAPALAQSTIQARKADRFVDSLGVNVHLESRTLPYSYKNYSSINLRLQVLGMRHLRDEMNAADASFSGQPLSTRFVDEIQSVGTLGYFLDGVIEGGDDYPPSGALEASHVVPMIQSLLPAIDTVEGPNEPDSTDSSGSFNFVYDGILYPQGAINESEDLWNIVKSSAGFPGPSISALPVVGMSEGYAPDFTVLANAWLADGQSLPFPYATYGNMHAYQGGHVGDNQLTGYYIPYSQELTGHDPLWTTEMGYHNYTAFLSDGEQQGVSERASAIYLPIAFLSGFERGVLRTFSYELIDESYGPNDPNFTSDPGEGHYGLLKYDLTPKPTYTALQNLISILAEPGCEKFDPGSLTITFSGAPDTMHYALLEKSTGAYYLAIWNDAKVYDLATETNPGKDVYPANVPVTLTFAAPQAFTVYAPNDSSGTSATHAYTLSTTPGSITLNLPPEVLVLEVLP
jgi:hypothetical protein